MPPRPKPTGAGRELWEAVAPELDRLGIAGAPDRTAFQLLCEAWGDYRQHRTGKRYNRVVEAWKRCRLMLIELGLTPAARTRVHADPSHEPEAPENKYLRLA